MTAAQADLAEGLVRADPAGPGITRSRCGRGFRYIQADGSAVAPAERARLRALAIPPAWTEVWICADPDGHIQAVGRDAAGRLQYRYHDSWRMARDREKFDRVLRLARRLPELRSEVAAQLGEGGLRRPRVLSGALRMLELGAFRVGSEQYAPDEDDEDGGEGSFGLATLRREHVRRVHGEVRVNYRAKGGLHRQVVLRDREVHRLVGALLRRPAGPSDLLVFHQRKVWHDVRAEDINGYLKDLVGDEFTAKDLRTWNATVLAATLLADGTVASGDSARAVRRAVKRACDGVAEHLGNTPTVARDSYIDPRVAEAFASDRTIARAVRRAAMEDAGPERTRDIIEPAVIHLLSGH